jgi:hypothetical protein
VLHSGGPNQSKILVSFLHSSTHRSSAPKSPPNPSLNLIRRVHSATRLEISSDNTIHMCVEQQVAMFLHTIGHNVRNRVIATNFGRSSETVSRYFNKVLHAAGELRKDYIRPPSLATPAKIAGNPKWDPYFKVQLYLHIIFQGIIHFWGAYMLLYCYNRIVSVLLMVHMYEPQFLRQWRLPSVVGKVTLPKM